MFRISILVTILLVSVIPGIARNNSRYVDPFIGTGAVEGGLSGNNYPGAAAPFGMVQLSPDTHRAPDWYNASGYPGNDDCGEMSAWYVFGALGFYPVNPASGQFSIGTPLFDKCTIHLPYDHDLTITANRSNPDNVEVKSIYLNGKKHKSLSLSRQDLVRGGSLHFEL